MSDSLSVAISAHVARVRAFYSTGATHSLNYRLRQLRQLSQLITENESNLIESMQADFRRAATEVQLYEIDSIKREIDYFISHLAEFAADRPVPSPLGLLPGESFIQFQPLGVSLIIGPFNYPFQLIFGPLIGSISAGNVAVIKPSSLFPTMSKLVGSLLPRYLEPNSIAWIIGSAAETTSLLSERFDYIFFTGSESVGKIVHAAAAKNLTPVTLELGGKSPAIVHSDADLALAARRIVWAKFMNAGAQCIGVDYCMVHTSQKSKFTDLLRKSIIEMYGADAKKSVDYAKIISDRQFDRLKGLIEADRSGLIYGGELDPSIRYISPTLIDATESSQSMKEEIFGPILPLLTYNSIEEAIQFVNSRPKPLALYFFSNSSAIQEKVLRSTTSGGAVINDTLVHYANKNLPFGGVGASGVGAPYHGSYSFYAFSHARAVVKKSIYGDAPARYPPYNSDKLKLVQFVNSIVKVDSATIRKFFRYFLIPLIVIFIARRLGVRLVLKK